VSGPPETRYLKTADDTYLAYQVVGNGPVDVAFGFNSDESNVDLIWDEPDWRPFIEGAMEFARVILHDRRGLGVSSRNVPPPNLETQVQDLLAVLDAAESTRALLTGGALGGAMHSVFAATHPDRAAGLVWNNPVARTAAAPDYPWGLGPEALDEFRQLADQWGTTAYGRAIAEWRTAERLGVPLSESSGVDDTQDRTNTYARINRNTATPDVAAEIFRIDWETDVRAILPSVHAPAALVSGTRDKVEEAEYVASLMPNGTLHVVEGRSGIAVEPILDLLRELAGLEPSSAALETVLSTVLFTDIVRSTEQQARVGDHAWKKVVLAHHAIVREALTSWRGVENDTAGDGFYATFDGPARAIRCALQICDRVRELGLEVRAGIHTGECEVIDGKHAGITVSTGARISALAGASEVLVSQTVKDLVAGSGLSFEDAGEPELRGIPHRLRLYRASLGRSRRS
jgi:class 3 adenylate cyclase/pimeloyl-ACP methyl ester carboxylesterase